MRLTGLALGLLTLICCTGLSWGDITTPSQGKSEAIGSYALGCLAGGIALPGEGIGYQVMRPSRNRFYGQSELINFIKNYTAKFNAESGKTILIGDLAQPRGGLMQNGHGSHQIGLDVDIWFLTMDHQQLFDEAKENLSAEFLVDKNGQINQQLWTASDVTNQLKTAAEFKQVDRIFVNPVIKQELCKTHQNEAWLRKIRPWWGHDEHFHVRLICPADNHDCITQVPLPKGNGCDASLAWWNTDEAKKPAAKANAKETTFAKRQPPSRCQAIMAE